jgi:glycine/D-amino acid oxidase-like deaminating enzyme/nitrite reductase/ring-hydroxylating ferredoxin subunit
MPVVGPLTADVDCDVCVVGAGIAGLLIAERLIRDGRRVVVLDAGTLAGGEASRTTAHFASALDDRFTELTRLHGERGAQIAAESHMAAIRHVEEIVRRLGIDCGWMRLDGYLAVNERHAARRDELLHEELTAARDAGLAVELAPRIPAPWPERLGACLRFRDQAQLHPLRFLAGVATSLLAAKARLYAGTHVTKVHGGRDTSVETAAGPVVRCAHVVVATNTPINNLVAIHTKQSGYQTYVSAFRIPAGALPALLLWDGLWEDDTAYHYVRLFAGAAEGDDLLIVGGEDHKTGQAPDGHAPHLAIESWTRAHFPMCGPVERRWSGQVMEPVDGLAYIGSNAVGPHNVYVVTGDSGNGMTHGAIAAMLVPDRIAGRANPWAELYDPARKVGVQALGAYAQENLNTLAQYRDWLRRGDVRSDDEIPPGSGAVVVQGARRLAVYRDHDGGLRHLRATCPHLHGVVRWNPIEHTWDCPCHGSRFDAAGKVLHGPAAADLEPFRGDGA